MPSASGKTYFLCTRKWNFRQHQGLEFLSQILSASSPPTAQQLQAGSFVPSGSEGLWSSHRARGLLSSVGLHTLGAKVLQLLFY